MRAILVTTVFVAMTSFGKTGPKEACDKGDMNACVAQAMVLQSMGEFREARKLLVQACDKSSVTGCLYLIPALQAAGEAEKARKLLETTCRKEPAACFAQAEAYGYTLDYASVLSHLKAACAAKHEGACKGVPSAEEAKASFDKKMTATIGKRLAHSRSKIDSVRRKIAGRPVDYDLARPEWSWNNIEREIQAQRLVNKRLRFSVILCSSFVPSDNKEEWGPTLECGGGNGGGAYLIVVDEKQARELPRRFRMPGGEREWFTGTVVEIRRTTRATPVVVTD